MRAAFVGRIIDRFGCSRAGRLAHRLTRRLPPPRPEGRFGETGGTELMQRNGSGNSEGS